MGIVDPLVIAGPEVADSLRDPESMLVAPEERVAVRPALVHASDEEWDKIGAELLRRGVVVEIDPNEAPVVCGSRILVGAFGVVKSGVPVPPATRVLRLIINAIPSNSVQRPILGDVEKMPVGGEWLYVCLGENDMILWSSDDISGCFHVFSLPVPWRRWMILSKPIRQPVRGSTDSRGVDRGCGGNAPRDHSSNVRLRQVWLALAVIPMGWLSAVGVVQHLHRRMVTAGVLRGRGLDPSAELVRGMPFPVRRPPSPSFWWKVYVDNFDIGEIMEKAKARKLVGKPSMSQVLYQEALGEYEVPRAEKKSVVRSEKAVTMGSFVDGLRGIASPALAKLLEHVALTAFVLSARRVPQVWVQAAVGRWVFDFQHRRPCFGTLSSIWAEITQWRGRKSLSDQSGDELCLCMGMVPLVFTDMRSELRKEIYATDASETGAGICMSTGVTKHGLKQAMIERETEEQLTADEAAASLVHGLLRRTDHRGTDVRMDLGLPFCAKAWPRTPISSKKWRWKTVLGYPWGQRGRHINEYELQALLSLSKWHARSARNIGTRLGVLTDSQVAMSVAAKGRSSSATLNRVLRRLDALLLAAFLQPFYGYVTSADNPADVPSRWFEDEM